MIKQSMYELQENYCSIEKLCLSSPEPIILCSTWQNRIVLMNQDAYETLVQDYDMSKYGIRLKRRDVTDYKEKVFIYCEETGEPVFIPTKSGKDVVFMDVILYNFLAGNPPEFEDDKPSIILKRKDGRVIPKSRAKVYSFTKAAARHKK